jgi:threonine dehydrogenase-like Zn-dependent dehydrogenase
MVLLSCCLSVRASYSLISSGTELKIFKGIFDNDAALDVNIKDMEDERMTYPLSYGYCLVGRIIGCGKDVPKEKYMDKLVYTFSAHASHVVTDAEAVQIVPDGINAQDAIFMPSVETALSLAHDAHVRLGENVAVYGQGLIGLLVTALLSRSSTSIKGKVDYSSKFGTITVFDMIPDRLAVASELGASQALIPGRTTFHGPFDVSIEVSGNARALQSAIDDTMNGGRIIVGSWYGNTDVLLKLGIDFHRSHKTIQTSQVSEIPASLSTLWTKQRRFSLAWELVKQIRPSRLLTKILSLDQAQEAYDALDRGSEIAVAFDHTPCSSKHIKHP